MPFSAGTLISNAGQVSTLAVAQSYTPIASDVLIMGVLHDNDGVMYVTADAPTVTRQFINGILHTAEGVRYISTAAAVHDWPEGFQTTATGAWKASDVLGVLQGFAHGIAIGDAGVFVTDVGGGGSPFDNLLSNDAGDHYLINDGGSSFLLIND